MRVLLIGPASEQLLVFRGPLLEALRGQGHTVGACVGAVFDYVADWLKERDIELFPVELSRRGVSVRGDLAYYHALRAVIRQFRPDVVLCYTIKPVIYGSMAAAREKVARRFSMIEGAGSAFVEGGATLRMVRWVVERLYRRALRLNEKVFFLNQDDEQLFTERGMVTADQVVPINGIGLDLAHYNAAPPSLDPLRFLMITRMIPEKGVRHFAEAARIVRSKSSNCRFALLGPFEEEGARLTEEEVRSWQAAGDVEYLGVTRDVRPVMRESSVFVLPSYREGKARTIMEALAMGRPIITTDAPGCREMVVEGETGFMVPPRNVPALVEAIEKFVADPQMVERMAPACRKYAEDNYDVHEINRQIMTVMGLV